MTNNERKHIIRVAIFSPMRCSKTDWNKLSDKKENELVSSWILTSCQPARLKGVQDIMPSRVLHGENWKTGREVQLE